MHSLIINNLTKIFRPKIGWFSQQVNSSNVRIAINDISFSLKKGEIAGLIGANGSGKSTLIHMLIGILSPSSGSIQYFGKDFSKNRSALLQDISFSSSYFKLAQSLTVMQNLKFFAQIYNMPQAIYDKKIDDLLVNFGLLDYKHKKISELSAGESNKIGILKAFLPNSKMVLLDEPTVFLDLKTAILVRTLIKKQRDEIGTTFFLASHSHEDIELCDSVLKLDKGHLQERVIQDYSDNKNCILTKAESLKSDFLDKKDSFGKP